MTADSKAMVVRIQFDMFEFDFGPSWDAEGFLRRSGCADFAGASVDAANAYGRPVLLMLGDRHVFRVFRPFSKSAPAIMAVAPFGAYDMHAVEITVDKDASYPFFFQPLINSARPIKTASN